MAGNSAQNARLTQHMEFILRIVDAHGETGNNRDLLTPEALFREIEEQRHGGLYDKANAAMMPDRRVSSAFLPSDAVFDLNKMGMMIAAETKDAGVRIKNMQAGKDWLSFHPAFKPKPPAPKGQKQEKPDHATAPAA